ncbi:unnamed protein product [Protopolystoma xenopodis]|uniref:Tetraspanin n=1 Tax=Protopolystoma xenopodis TaxID=117903 RepID=A0A3S5APN4_9PLAT|nr:unnamed protein product [Protopolystoma xenopodis]
MATLGFAVFLYLEPYAQDFIHGSGQEDVVMVALYTLMCIGGVTLIVALLGCCGAYHESQCALGTYFTLLIVIFAAQVAASVMGYIFRDEVSPRMFGLILPYFQA